MIDLAIGGFILFIGVVLFLTGAVMMYSVLIERTIFSSVSIFGIVVSISGLYCIAAGLLEIGAVLNSYR